MVKDSYGKPWYRMGTFFLGTIFALSYESLKKFIKENQSRIYTDIAEQYSFIAQSDWAVGYAEEQYPDVQFHKTMEI